MPSAALFAVQTCKSFRLSIDKTRKQEYNRLTINFITSLFCEACVKIVPHL